jgi:hypothetical protein
MPTDKPEARYLIETETSEYWCDDYLIRMFGVECFRMIDGIADNFIIYQPLTAIHDYTPKLNSIAAFQKMKRKELRKAHKSYKEAEELAAKNPNSRMPEPSPIDCQ